MNEKVYAILEFDKIRRLLADRALTEGARQRALELIPSCDMDKICRLQLHTADAKRLQGQKGTPSFGSVRDIHSACERAEKGAVLSMRELLDCANVLRTARSLLEYSNSDRLFDTALDEIFQRLIPIKALEERISRAIISEEMVADDASPALLEICQKIRKTNARIADLMEQYTGGAYSKYLQENIITTRGGRFVIPVKSEYKNEIKGLVHDTSASGATLFIEPMRVVEANNELRQLQSEKEHEIERILWELSGMVADSSFAIVCNYENITELAYIFACGELAYRMDACAPEITQERKIELRRCRHPLISDAVPVDILIGGDYSMLVITGPNTGGKTVALKTLGLFCLMAQAGLQLPCETASICIFDAVFADIGDEQSIEQSLSTFSSHMVGIVSVLKSMTDRSLVLFDELGSGTDPVEGAALATSILEEVLDTGAICAATTHYAELKAFAIERDGVCNASCEFDVETLRPTYRLMIGTPGKSNAFAISQRLGISRQIIERAKGYVDQGSRSFEATIEKMEAQRFALETEKEKARALRIEYERFKQDAEAQLQKKLGDAEKEAARIMDKARQTLDSARASSDYILKQLDEAKRAKDTDNFGDKIAAAKKNIKSRVKDFYDKNTPEEKEDDYVLPRALKKGDTVMHRSLGTKGTLLENPDKKGNVMIQMGILKTKMHISQLRLLDDATTVGEKGKQTSRSAYKAAAAKSFKPELDVRGMIGDDACFMLDRYLDDALVAGIYSVTVIHGKGTGALRQAVWNYLKRDSRVESYRVGQYGEGDYGVTVVELRRK